MNLLTHRKVWSTVRAMLVALLLSFGFSLRAEYLYWAIDLDDITGSAEWTAARVAWDNGSESGYLMNGNGSELAAYEYITVADYFTANIGDFDHSTYTYWVELVNNSQVVGESARYTYTELSGHIYKGGMSIPDFTTWFPPINAPEPTGGLLMMIGAAYALLRRRHQV